MDESGGRPLAARGAAWQRRQRRLRSMLRHLRQTVAMELAAALHHSWGGWLGKNVGLRAQKTASAGLAEYFELASDGQVGSGRRHCWSRGSRARFSRSSSTVMDVSVILQRHWVATVEVPQIQFIAGVSGHSSSQQRWALGFQQWRLWRR